MIDIPVSFITEEYFGLFLAVALGLFIGLEREMSRKMAGVRTFTLICILGSGLAVYGNITLLSLGFGVVLLFSLLMGMKDLLTEEDIGLSLTTSAALVLTYVSGMFAGFTEFFIAIFIGVVTAGLLISKDILHNLAGDITDEELRSALELAAISFIIYPILPSENIGPLDSIDAQLVWLLVIAVSGLGFINYFLVKKYQRKGFIATGFFGGLVNSTAVIGTISDRVSKGEASKKLAISAILLANSAMAIRNAVIVTAFVPETITIALVPLLMLGGFGILLAYITIDLDTDFTYQDLKSPFRIKTALSFGVLFLIIIVISAVATELIGKSGFYISMFLAGLVSSGSSTTTAVTLVSTQQISPSVAAIGVLIGSAASIVAKVALVSTMNKKLLKPVLIWSLILIIFGVVSTFATLYIL